MKKKKVYLTLQNGKVFEGYRFGAEGNPLGELVFTTGMVGYDKTLTDPAYFGQIVVQTFPMIGNYGIIESEFESDKPQLSAYVVREYCEAPSNFRTEETLENYMQRLGIVGVYGVDTRELTRILREEGTMNARISDKPYVFTEEDKAYKPQNAVASVCNSEVKVYENENAKYTVAFWDFGAKRSSFDELVAAGFRVIRAPYSYTAEQILALNVDGVVIGDGPGDPAENKDAIAELQKLIGKKPVFAFGLGHQLVALALGAKTAKMKYGHRGGNQPVKALDYNRVYISSQNHGYEVVADSVKAGKIDFVNVNDGSVEGISYDAQKAFTVQFAPSACSAACEPNILYNKFISIIEKGE
ncbi:MAG: glutamine-hydrolyzing carbamoyl-phosphate synthase small subunit [Clostridia bacterium]|nr:glutamine-hydrolyzing carbamoyl-phosphate synthase small subunit [Clostridia bacterium]